MAHGRVKRLSFEKKIDWNDISLKASQCLKEEIEKNRKDSSHYLVHQARKLDFRQLRDRIVVAMTSSHKRQNSNLLTCAQLCTEAEATTSWERKAPAISKCQEVICHSHQWDNASPACFRLFFGPSSPMGSAGRKMIEDTATNLHVVTSAKRKQDFLESSYSRDISETTVTITLGGFKFAPLAAHKPTRLPPPKCSRKTLGRCFEDHEELSSECLPITWDPALFGQLLPVEDEDCLLDVHKELAYFLERSRLETGSTSWRYVSEQKISPRLRELYNRKMHTPHFQNGDQLKAMVGTKPATTLAFRAYRKELSKLLNLKSKGFVNHAKKTVKKTTPCGRPKSEAESPSDNMQESQKFRQS